VHHDETIGDGKDIWQRVGDQNDRDTPIAELANEREDLLLLRNAKIVGWLIHDHQLGVPIDCSRNGNRLALAAREVLDGLLEVREMDFQRLQRGP
jgi:hypothetical protein